jgi:AraC-like DNA-binding protein
VVANFQLQPAFLEEAAGLLRVDFRRLNESAVRIVALDEPLESLCRFLMQEVAGGCKLGSSFFESLSRALAAALVQRLVPTPPALGPDPRIERAVRFIEQHFQEKISLKKVAEVAGINPYHFLRAFSATVGVSPHEYVIRCRLRHAQRLIISSARSRLLADIAVEAGFYDEAHLRGTGSTPITPVIPISFRKDNKVLNYFSMVTMVGTPQTVAAQELRIESMFPADEETENDHMVMLGQQ